MREGEEDEEKWGTPRQLWGWFYGGVEGSGMNGHSCPTICDFSSGNRGIFWMIQPFFPYSQDKGVF